MKDIGEVSDEKAKLIIDKLSKFSTRQLMPFGLLLFKNENPMKSLIVSPNQIVFSQRTTSASLPITPEFDEIKESIKTIYDIFLLGYKCSGVLSCSGVMFSVNSYEDSLRFSSIDLGDVAHVRGVGLRLFLRSSDFVGDFRFEPYIKEENYFFAQLECSLSKGNDIDTLIDQSKELVEVFKATSTQVYGKFIL